MDLIARCVTGQARNQTRRRALLRRAVSVAIVATAIVGTLSTTNAMPLNLSTGNPDITVDPVDISYDSVSDVFSAVGTVSSAFSAVNATGAAVPITVGTGTFNLTAMIDNSGNLAGPGALTITGDIGHGVQTLVAGSLTAFGFDDSAKFAGLGVFEGLFGVTSSAASLGYGSTAGIIMSSADLPLNWNFAVNFEGTAPSDTFKTAEPSAIAFVLVGFVSLAWLHRRRHRHALTSGGDHAAAASLN